MPPAEMTLAEALEAALDGTATREDVIKAIDAELEELNRSRPTVEGRTHERKLT